jgi:hypothetical protein
MGVVVGGPERLRPQNRIRRQWEVEGIKSGEDVCGYVQSQH